MESKAKLFGHSIHQMLIPFPLGLMTTGALFDLIHLLTGNANWATSSFVVILAGVVGGALAAIFGVIDFLAIPTATRAYRIGITHGLGNVLVVILFGASLLLRMDHRTEPGVLAVGLSLLGAGLGMVTGWLGGELVDRLGVGVDDGANLNAPSSLSGPAVRERPVIGD